MRLSASYRNFLIDCGWAQDIIISWRFNFTFYFSSGLVSLISFLFCFRKYVPINGMRLLLLATLDQRWEVILEQYFLIYVFYPDIINFVI